MTPQEFCNLLKGVRKSGTGWSARCPAHKDRNPSLTVGLGDDGRILVNCHRGCTPEQICAAIDIKVRDLFPNATAAAKGRVSKRHAPQPKAWGSHGELVAYLERTLGRRLVAQYDYGSTASALQFGILRFERDGSEPEKTFRPYHRTQAGWFVADPSGQLPLYGSSSLGDASTVFVVEGEKCVDAATSIGLTATTSAHGADGTGRTDWSPLTQRMVAVLPDHDEPGEGYASKVQGHLAELPGSRVKFVRLPDLDDGEDIVEFIERRRSAGRTDGEIREEIEALVATAPEAEVEPEAASQKPPSPVGFSPFPTAQCATGEREISDELPPKVHAVLNTDRRLKALFEGHGKPSVGQDGKLDTTSSGHDFSLALEMHQRGFTEDEIAATLQARPDGAAKAKGSRYIFLTIQNAAALVAQAEASAEQPDFVVERVRIFNSNPPTYELTIGGVPIRFSTGDLLSKKPFSRRYCDALHRVPTIPGKAPEWKAFVNGWLEKAEVEELPPDASEQRALCEAIERVIADLPEGEDRDELDKGRSLVLDGVGQVFKTESVVRRLKDDWPKASASKVAPLLRDLGYGWSTPKIDGVGTRVWARKYAREENNDVSA